MNVSKNVMGLLLFFALVVCGQWLFSGKVNAADADEQGITMEVILDFMDTASGEVGVHLIFRGFEAPPMFFKPMGSLTEFSYNGVTFLDENGGEIPWESNRGRYVLSRGGGDTVEAKYRIGLGLLGRHGHQGYANENFALFDGRTLLLPQFAHQIHHVSFTFNKPTGWIVATPHQKNGDQYTVENVKPEEIVEVLINTCMGVGPFERASQNFGDTEVSVFSMSTWEEAHKENLNTKSFRVFEYFFESIGFDPGNTFSILWTPQPGANRVFGGSFSNAVCFEHPVDSTRNWQLLGHRIGHAVNKYLPTGMLLGDKEDHWFLEGWASYVEVLATEASGIVEDGRYFNILYDRYLRQRGAFPEWDIALGDETQAPKDAVEFLHYTKAPLAVRMLDHWLVNRCDGDLIEFMGVMYRKYGEYEGVFSLRQELDGYCSDSLDDFWATVIDVPGMILPVWSEYVTETHELRFEEAQAVQVGDESYSGDFLFHLATSGEFEHFSDIQDYLQEVGERRSAFKASGFDVIADHVREHSHTLSIDVRMMLLEFEESYPLHLLPPPSTGSGIGGCLRGTSRPSPPTWALDQSDPDGAVFAQLLDMEHQYRPVLAGLGMEGIVLEMADEQSVEPTPRILGFTSGDEIKVISRWTTVPAELHIASMDGEEVISHDSMAMEPGWHRGWKHFGPKDVSSEPGVAVFRVWGDGKVPVQRGFWQRDP